jgi:hypothetical protein
MSEDKRAMIKSLEFYLQRLSWLDKHIKEYRNHYDCIGVRELVYKTVIQDVKEFIVMPK